MTPNSLSNFEKEEQSRRDNNTWHQTILQGHCNQKVWYWHKNRYENQRNRTESPEINPLLYGQLIFDKGSKSIKWSIKSLFNKLCWEIWIAKCKKMKLNHQVTPYAKINSRWIEDLNTSYNTITALEENIGRKISDISRSNIFTNMSSRARDIKERINK